MDTLTQSIVDNTSHVASPSALCSVNVWMVIAIVELFVIIIIFISRNRRGDKRIEMKKKVLSEGDVDFANLVNSSFNAERLYKDLIIKCHPDRFAPDETKMKVANELSERLAKNKHDIKCLEALRDEAKTKLNINI